MMAADSLTITSGSFSNPKQISNTMKSTAAPSYPLESDLPLTPVPSLVELLKPVIASGAMLPPPASKSGASSSHNQVEWPFPTPSTQGRRAAILNTLEQVMAMLDDADFDVQDRLSDNETSS